MSRKLPKVLDDQEKERFLDQFNKRYQSPHRNFVMCKLMLDTGLRVSEVTGLKMDHIDWADHGIIVREGKGAKDRKVWFSDEMENMLREWIERKPDSDYLFPTNSGGEIDHGYLRRMVKKTAKKSDVSEAEKVSPHTLRHTFATDFYRETKDLHTLQNLLGHENIETTEIYVHLVDEDAKEAVRNFRKESKVA
jgi:integrase/recombinase XerD